MEKLPVAVTLSTFILKAQASNFDKVVGYPDSGYCFSTVSPGECSDNAFK
jgi:hypothetical protein